MEDALSLQNERKTTRHNALPFLLILGKTVFPQSLRVMLNQTI
jgi:hypothetical protein